MKIWSEHRLISRRISSLSFVSLVLFMLHTPLSQAQQRAVPVTTDILYGGRALAIATRHDNPDHLLVASETGGLFRSANGGANWRQVSGNFTYEFSHVAFSPTNNQLAIATAYSDFRTVSGGGIWRSTNSGGDFTKVSTPMEGCSQREEAYAIAFEPNAGRIWVGTVCGLLYSDNEGSTWTALPASGAYTRQPIYSVQVPAPGKLKIMTVNSVLVSEDRGVTWSGPGAGVPSAIVDYNKSKSFNQLAVSPYNTNHIFWAVAFGEDRYTIDPNGVRQRRVASITAVLLSTDNGANWRELHREELDRYNRAVSVILSAGFSNLYDLYFNNGVGTSKALIGTINNQLASEGWLPLRLPHPDNIDVSFLADGRTLNMIAGDGGIYKTTDNGSTFAPAGFHRNGYNALQLYQVAGQLKTEPNTSILYLGTQDNGLWSSIYDGMSSHWPSNQSLGGEGRFIELLRRPASGTANAVTGTFCCSRFITDPLFLNFHDFPGCYNQVEAPKLMRIAEHYMQRSNWDPAYGTRYFTSRTLGSWQPRFSISNDEYPSGFPQISGSNTDPVVFIPVKSNVSDMPHEELQQVTGVMNILSGSPVKSAIEGYGKMGAFNMGFASERLFAVNPNDPSHIIIPDVISHKVRVTRNGGSTWQNDDVLTDLVTDHGTFLFNVGDTLFISAINFHPDPDRPNTIMVGTRQNGAFLTNDGGDTWTKIADSENIPLITSFYFESEGAEISSYGRGLWHIPSVAKELPTLHYERYLQWIPYYYHGCFYPLNSIIHPETLNAVRLMSVNKGCVTGYETDEEGNLLSISIDKGEVSVMDLAGKEEKMPDIPLLKGKGKVNGIDKDAQEIARKNKWVIKGLLLEGKKLKGPVYFSKDLKTEYLPKPRKERQYFTLNLSPTAEGYRISSFDNEVQLQGAGWDSTMPLQILMDGKPWPDKIEPKFDSKGNLQMSLYLPPSMGKHTLKLFQKTAAGILSASTVIYYNYDEEEKD